MIKKYTQKKFQHFFHSYTEKKNRARLEPKRLRVARLQRGFVFSIPLQWLLLLGILCAATFAVAADPPKDDVVHGLAPLPHDVEVPANLLPPGSPSPDNGPSDVIFPQQNLTIRFNHKFHVTEGGATCKTCHALAYSSASAQDALIPKGTTCDACHDSDHSDPNAVKPGGDAMGKCGFCHVGYKEGDGNIVARLVMPRANMVFNHQKHVSRNIGCGQCHGAVQELELATRDQLPRMAGCFKCHENTDSAARGTAKSECTTCHLRSDPKESGTAAGPLDSGRIRTLFASGVLKPPRWMHNSQHGADWIERHKMAAGANSEFCANCHKEDFCVGCHDGRTRPRSIHPNDYISMHPIDARQEATKCQSCHNEQSFCLTCHMRLGITMSGPQGARDSGRFHPPKQIWSDAPRQPGHHSFEAERNLNACVSCHIERDCVTCHGGSGIGGGFNPHPAGFSGGCGTQMRRNPRPCLVCHEPGAAVLSQCR